MKKRRTIPGYMGLFLTKTGFLLKNEKGQMTGSDARRALYLYKVLDIVWFENFIPNNYEEKFPIVLNTSWEWKDQMTDTLAIVDLNEESLRYISGRLRTPLWISMGKSFLLSVDDIIFPDL